MIFFGLRLGEQALTIAGLVFRALLVLVLALNRHVLKSSGTYTMAAMGYWGIQLPILFLGWGGGSFSYLSAPTDSYLSLISETPLYVQDLVNIFFAPRVENLLILSETVLIYQVLRAEGLPRIPSFIVAVALGCVTFAFLHGVRSTAFFIRAFVLMAIIAGGTVGVDLNLLPSWLFPVSLGAGFGLHQALNAVMGGGLFEYYSTLLLAPEPYKYLAWAIIGWDALMFLAALYGVVVFGVLPVVNAVTG
ncbi:MAG: hypothetical protein SVU32_09235 [Candidatus Nanohaloarchaea archaeon]|nr:hypothetical protein [Candidatus Nanohaloarchaea archaeon]